MITAIAFGCFGVASLCGACRLFVGPDLADRVVGLDVILVSLMGAITIQAARSNNTTYLVLLVVLAIVGFTATVAASRFVEDETEMHTEICTEQEPTP
ncbi:MAG: monovalent cation/H+ antiporter complex subunit F [bacterium]|nr:monovalent cation/H+ antiporter complex subunit F [bacterium]MCY4162659.1 monovalent cation/H+ antiporter complex subunit F [bacterium]MCY4258315.1 monovalent cation/H+ antiporter complex subunit F [bacterium]